MRTYENDEKESMFDVLLEDEATTPTTTASRSYFWAPGVVYVSEEVYAADNPKR